MSGWRSMDTAPRDGSAFLAYNPVVGPYVTAFTTRWTGGFWPNGLGSYPFGRWDCAPCAWMPIELPPPALRSHPANLGADDGEAVGPSPHRVSEDALPASDRPPSPRETKNPMKTALTLRLSQARGVHHG